MTPEHFAEILRLLRWRATEVAQWCGYHPNTGKEWLRGGKGCVPPHIEVWLEARLLGRLEPPPFAPAYGVQSRYLELLNLLRWSTCAVAVECGYATSTGTNWAKGASEVPAEIMDWLEARAAGEMFDPPKVPHQRGRPRTGCKNKPKEMML